jgi:hypothetical protein
MVWVVIFTPRPLNLWTKSSHFPLNRRLSGPKNRSGRFREEKFASTSNRTSISHTYSCAFQTPVWFSIPILCRVCLTWDIFYIREYDFIQLAVLAPSGGCQLLSRVKLWGDSDYVCGLWFLIVLMTLRPEIYVCVKWEAANSVYVICQHGS